MRTPDVPDLCEALEVFREWQRDDAPFQLHPGDLGWAWRFGAEQTAATTRTWWRGDELLAIGAVDPDLLRLAVAPSTRQDEELAKQVLADVGPGGGVLTEATAYVESPRGGLLKELLAAAGWEDDQPWTPLRRDLSEPVEEPGVRIEVTGPDRVADRVAAQLGAWDRSTFTEDKWRAMAAGPAYADARCLVALDDDATPVAAITVWSAGPGRPGLVEPMGVHRDHRGHGLGRAITLAGAAALRDLGSSSAVVATPSSNVGGVATYVAAGFERLPDVRDQRRGG